MASTHAPVRSKASHPFNYLLREKYDLLFVARWPAWAGGLAVGLLNILLFAFYKPWGTSDGMRNWGDWIFKSIGFSQRDVFAPWLSAFSLLNLGVILGAAVSALMARKFSLRKAGPQELLKGLVGGGLMGVGASIALGCNIGGFLSALSAFSLSGLGMMGGLFIGAFLGHRFLPGEETSVQRDLSRRLRLPSASGTRNQRLQPYLGMGLLVVLVLFSTLYDRLGYADRGVLLLFGIGLGMVTQRARFSMVRAFREPFSTGNAEMTRAAILALLVSAIGFAILKSTGLRSPDESVFPSFFLGSFLGGIIFGFGMVLAGGCGAGSLWRAGEGNLRLWPALLGFSLAASSLGAYLDDSGWRVYLGRALFLPEIIGWKYALLSVFGILATWYLFVSWIESQCRLPSD